MKFNYNYHTHTYRCGHASGTPEEYIQRAIKNGIQYMGFSDHAPIAPQNNCNFGLHILFDEWRAYVEELSLLREKYKEKIDLLIGFEIEYYPFHFKSMLQSAIEAGVEYLILGQHFIDEGFPLGAHTSEQTENPKVLLEYAARVIAGIQSGAFTYVAHPDLCNFIGDHALYQQEMRKICVAAREYNTPLEINCLGIRDHRSYPKESFWAIAGEEKSPVVFGFDAHDSYSAFDGDSLAQVDYLIKTYDLNYIGRPTPVIFNNLNL